MDESPKLIAPETKKKVANWTPGTPGTHVTASREEYFWNGIVTILSVGS